jgi:hypothetical protein
MISRKNRPANGPGANHLRGPKEYSAKTAVGSWIENAGGPAGYHRGFTTEEYMTECQHLQNGNKKIRVYGSGLPLDDEVENPRKVKDLFHPREGPTSTDWKSSSQVMMESILVPKAEHSYRNEVVSPTKSKHNVDEYIASWTVDTVEGRKVRFNPESRRAANVAVNEDFKVPSVRLVPGVPNGFERLIAGLTDRYGILGLSAFRSEIGSSGQRNGQDLRIALKNCGVNLPRVDFLQVMAYMTPGDSFQAEKILRIITPNSEGTFDASKVGRQFDETFGGEEAVSSHDVVDLYPRLQEALLEFIGVYASEGLISKDDFVLLHSDLFHSMPLKYKAMFP